VHDGGGGGDRWRSVRAEVEALPRHCFHQPEDWTRGPRPAAPAAVDEMEEHGEVMRCTDLRRPTDRSGLTVRTPYPLPHQRAIHRTTLASDVVPHCQQSTPQPHVLIIVT